MKIFEKLRNAWEAVKFNLLVTVFFVIMFTALNFFAAYVIAKLYLNILTLIGGTKYIGPDNLASMMLNPFAWIFIIIFSLLFCIFSIFEVSGLVYTFSMSRIGIKVRMGEVIHAALSRCKRTLKPRNWSVILFILLISPICTEFAMYQSTLHMMIPEFITDFIFANPLLAILGAAGFILLYLVFVMRIFALVIYVREDITFSEATKRSANLVKPRWWKILIFMLVVYVLARLLFTGVGGSAAGMFGWIRTLIGADAGTITGAYVEMRLMQILVKLLFALFMPVITLSFLTVLCEEYGEKPMSPEQRPDRKRTGWIAVFNVSVIAIVFFNIFFHSFFFKELYAECERPAIVAHRGDSVRAPENTMPAFRIAMMEFPEYLEFDVHQTKDGEIIVSHDDNLQRVTGKNIYMHDLTYDEAMQLDVGSWFSKDYEGLHFTSFDDALEYFKDYPDVTLQIEIKPTGFDKDIEKCVIDIINENNMHDRCMITSLDLPTLKRVKEVDPTMTTVYSMSIAYGNVETIEYIDHFTVEQSNVSPELVANIHRAGKKCFAWTANTEETVEFLIVSGVDGILTDDPIMMRNALDGASYGGGTEKLLRYFVNNITYGI